MTSLGDPSFPVGPKSSVSSFQFKTVLGDAQNQVLHEVLDCCWDVRDFFGQIPDLEILSSGPILEVIYYGESCIKLIL